MLYVIVIAVAAILAGLPLLALRSSAAARLAEALAGPFRSTARAAYAVACGAALLLLLVQLSVVVLVSVFSVSVIWLQESTAYLFAAMFLLGAGWVFVRDAHVRVDVLSSRWSERRRAAVDLGGVSAFVVPVCALIVLVSAPWAARSWAELERSGEPSGLHLVFLLKTMVPMFAVILALAAFVQAEAAVRRLRRS